MASEGAAAQRRPVDGKAGNAPQLQRRARNAAAGHPVDYRPGDPGEWSRRLRLQENFLDEVRNRFAAAGEGDLPVSYAAEWLLDNYHLVRQSLRQIRTDLPTEYFQRLPKLTTGPGAGRPRIYALATDVLAACNGHADLEQLELYIDAYQNRSVLTTGEIWALPIMLRMGVIEALARAAGEVARLEPREGVLPDSRFAADDIPEETVANTILSLRLLSSADWKVFFERVSRVDRILSSEPAGVYAAMDFATRDRYRKAVEDLARKAGRGEAEVAEQAVRMARKPRLHGQPKPARERHVGYYLVDEGRSALELRLGYHPPITMRWRLRLRPGVLYLGAIALVAIAIVWAVARLTADPGAGWSARVVGGILAVVPALVVSVGLVNWGLTLRLKPRILPKLDFSSGIPDAARTIVVVPALLTDFEEIDFLLHQLELHHLSNPDPNLRFALLSDLVDSVQEHRPEDEGLIRRATAGIEALNRKYPNPGGPPPFGLFHRPRRWNPGEELWMGWERKRGKLEEFNGLLLGGAGDHAFSVRVGDPAALRSIRYVITLDGDTLLPRDSAHRLVGTIAHPLNQPLLDRAGRKVVKGYGVIQPRTEVKPTSADRTRFTRLFAGDTTMDLYTLAVSDVYQDLFGEGIFVGKGIYEVAAFSACADGRVPDNHLLSHDLFEGLHARVGLASDIVLLEEYPPTYFAFARRSHRWMRGDWQLLPWLAGRVPSPGGPAPSPLTLVGRWKIIDNLVRSLLAPCLLALLACAWWGWIGAAWAWTLFALLAPAVPMLIGLASDMVARLREGSTGRDRSVRTRLLRWLLVLAFLPYEALLSVDAVLRTLYRVAVSRKRMLQWTTSAHTLRLINRHSPGALARRQMGGASVVSLVLAAGVFVADPPTGLAVSPLLASWVLSPWIAWRISRPLTPEAKPLAEGQRYLLRRLARRTWFYFEDFVGPDDHWLPPDHFQEHPRGLPAHRTSPTNIGLTLLSSVCAFELGYIDQLVLASTLRNALATLDRLERYRGHFLNWYDTRTLKPLPPRYVSTVDSGNLAMCLLAVGEGCAQACRVPVLHWQRWQGLLDTIDVLDEMMQQLDPIARESVSAVRTHWRRVRDQVVGAKNRPELWPALLVRLNTEEREELDRRLSTLVESGRSGLGSADLGRLRMWSERVHRHLFAMQRAVSRLAPWMDLVRNPPELLRRAFTDPLIAQPWEDLVRVLSLAPPIDGMRDFRGAAAARIDDLTRRLRDRSPDPLLAEAVAWCARVVDSLQSAEGNADAQVLEYRRLSEQANGLAAGTAFDFLFDSRRQLFHIGYNVDTGMLDANYYDLLASEARIASLIAISKGDVPQRHWLHLARPITRAGDSRVLMSWSGTMFEYLMPNLFFQTPENTLLWQSSRAAVDRQIGYAQRKGVPWGISESAYYHVDAGGSYQYRAFGVPGLGFKRGLEDDLVIAPYASIMALSLRPRRVMRNIERLIETGLLGDHGFYEAVDFTPGRLALGQERALVRSFYSHHQGMIFISMANYLLDETVPRRLRRHPLVQSVELLLHEQIPPRATVEESPEETVAAGPAPPANIRALPWGVPVRAAFPQAHILSNGRYSVMLTSAGAGFSRWRDIDLTRWRADTTLEDWGAWVYLQDRDSGDSWSATYLPHADPDSECSATFSVERADFRTHAHGVSVHVEVTVPPEDDLEIRRVTLRHSGFGPRRLRIVSYAEACLAPQATDRRHPVFNSLFIQSEVLPELNALLISRRPRQAAEEAIYVLHMLVPEGMAATGACETDRARFLGRGGSARNPAAMEPGGVLSGTVGATFDPIWSLGQDIDLTPGRAACVTWLTMAGSQRREVLDLAARYRNGALVAAAFDQARAQSEREMRRLNLDHRQIETAQKLLSLLLHPHPVRRAEPAVLAANRLGQSALWRFGVSGDDPILLARIASEEHAALAADLLRVHDYWRSRHLRIELVLLDTGGGYGRQVQSALHRLVGQSHHAAWLNRRGGIFIVQSDQLNPAERTVLESAALVVLDGNGGPLSEQLNGIEQMPAQLPDLIPGTMGLRDPEPTPTLERPAALQFDNGFGGFNADGSEYQIFLPPGEWTPAPWVNVIANDRFGFVASEGGCLTSWAFNSGENRLSTWGNDPVRGRPSEAIYLRDEETARIWSPTPLPARANAPYLIRHGAGYSIYEHHSNGLLQAVRMFAAADEPLKIVHLRLTNVWNRPRRITVTYYLEWVLGSDRDRMQAWVIPEYDAERNALLARNPFQPDFAECTAFLASGARPHGLTTDRTEFLGRMGGLDHPAGMRRIGLAGAVRAGSDPCAAIQVHVDLAPGESRTVHYLVGQGASRGEALALVERFGGADRVQPAWEQARAAWEERLNRIQVDTPDPAMNLLLNRWLPYQNLSCRVWGRSALYQSSGAFGFRDQLQDGMALVHSAPEVAREHILRAARHQFEAGDVLHWFHPPSGRGVRTRMSDDLLWLPFAAVHYVQATGDHTLWAEPVPFLRAAPLEPEEEERYGLFEAAPEAFSLYEHCLRAIARGTTAGAHGLPLIGTGDWNDGMNRVGAEGKGESVWLAWFLCATLAGFAPVCTRMGDGRRAEELNRKALELAAAVEAHAWDGGWYLRGFYDDGAALGSSRDLECRIDAIAQSWAVLSGAARPERAAMAMNSVAELLVSETHQLVRLFTPPFDASLRDPGYIKGYPPGVRENGGQYTHAAIWTVWAFAALGKTDLAERLFRMINPVYHSDTADKARLYRVEPYVVAADVHSEPPHAGRGGWTWYTGSAGWMYRLGIEAILGLVPRGDCLRFRPRLPNHWDGYRLTYRWRRSTYHVHATRERRAGEPDIRVHLDGREVPGEEIPLVDDGAVHRVDIHLRTPRA
jgi:cyclic beta-1,2-glucan synthetase